MSKIQYSTSAETFNFDTCGTIMWRKASKYQNVGDLLYAQGL